MKKFYLSFVFFVFASMPLLAQVTYNTVTATVTDPGGFTYANAAFHITLVDQAGYPVSSVKTPNGSLFNAKAVNGSLDANGYMSVSLAPNTLFSRTTFWKISIGPPDDTSILTYGQAWNTNYQVAISGDVDLSTQLSALAQRISYFNLKTGQSTITGGTSFNGGTITTQLNAPSGNFVNGVTAQQFNGPIALLASPPSCITGAYWIAPIAGTTNAWQQCANGVVATVGAKGDPGTPGANGTPGVNGLPGGSLSYPGVTSDADSGLVVTKKVTAATVAAAGALLGSTSPVRTISCLGSDDAALLQAAVNGLGHIITTGNCAISTTVVTIPSQVWLENTGTVTCSIAPCIVNAQYLNQTVNRTFATAVTTAGSTTLTSSTGAFTGADQGQTIRCTGALGTAPTLTGYPGVGSSTLFTSITTVTNGTTISLADAAGVTFTSGSPTSCSILYRDHNIRISGGKFIFTGPTVGGATPQHLLFGTVNDITLQNILFQNGSTGASSASGSKNVAISDASRVLVDNLTFNSWVTLQDGIDMYGPLRDFTVRNIYGHTGDNSVAVTIFGLSPSPSQGVVSGGLIENVNTAAGFGAIRLFGADGGATVLMNDVTVRHYHAVISGGIQGTGNGVELFYGNFDNILIDDVSGMMQQADVYVAGATVGSLTAKNLSQEFSAFNAAGSLFRGGVGGIAGVGPTINNLILDGLKVNGYNLPNFAIFGSTPCVNWTASVNHMQVNNSQFYNLSGAITGPFVFCDMTIGDLAFNNVQLNYNTANAPPALGIITAANGAVGKVSLNGVHVSHQSGSLSGGSLFTLGTIGGVSATLGDLEMSDVSYTSPASLSGTYLWLSTPSGTSPAFSTLSNIRLDHITGCNAYTGTGTGLVQMTSLFATNLATPSLCVTLQNGLANVVAKASVTNQSAAIGTTVLYTPPTAGIYRYDCNIATGSATGTGTAIVSVLNSAANNWIACPTLIFSASAEQSCSVVVNKAVSSNLDYMTAFTAGTGGNYNLSCAVTRLQ